MVAIIGMFSACRRLRLQDADPPRAWLRRPRSSPRTSRAAAWPQKPSSACSSKGDFGFKMRAPSGMAAKTTKLAAESASGRLAIVAIISTFFQRRRRLQDADPSGMAA
eukprot:1146282-Heterocapsa_arctica.AAC.1